MQVIYTCMCNGRLRTSRFSLASFIPDGRARASQLAKIYGLKIRANRSFGVALPIRHGYGVESSRFIGIRQEQHVRLLSWTAGGREVYMYWVGRDVITNTQFQ